MIGGLQGDFGDLDNKYLKQNIPKYHKMSVGNIRKLQENTAALYTERKTLRVSVIRRSGYVYPEKLKRPALPSGCEISGCKMSAYGIPDVKCQRTEFLPGWNELCCAKGDRLRVQGVGTPFPDDTECARLSGSTPSGFPQEDMRTCYPEQIHPDSFRRTCGVFPYPDSWTSHPDDSISYPDVLSGSLT